MFSLKIIVICVLAAVIGIHVIISIEVHISKLAVTIIDVKLILIITMICACVCFHTCKSIIAIRVTNTSR